MLRDRDSKQSIQVAVRVRPVSQRQLTEDPRTCVTIEQGQTLQVASGNQVKCFAFDSICYNFTQEQIFERLGRKCALDCLEGYNCTVFAYGQTGAGKTYTMIGSSLESQDFEENRGLVPRTMEFLFDCIDKQREMGINFVIRCSFLEIYNEQIIDLLNKSNTNMQLRQDTRKGVYVQGITEQNITRSEEAIEILCRGSKSRHTGSTNYNESSSRSHSVFTLQIESKYTKNGVVNTKSRQLNFVDLAGSERTKQSTGERLKEGCNINKSLMNLSSVINALSQVSQGKVQHVNYRNSKLTFLLKDSLGGNSKTTLIANISPSNLFHHETISTLGFARRAKLIKREKASINEDSSGNLQSMKSEIKRLKQEVINLMSRYQEKGSLQQNKENPTQLTLLMHQYLEEEIQKQTKLQIEILKMNDRIVQLQRGMKQFSSNEIHLRMVISVYEDKINRLKYIQQYLNKSIEKVAQKDEAINDYFKNERISFINEIKSCRDQAQNNKFLKELMKQAKIMKEQGEDENLKDLLIKNTQFLNTIHSKLSELKPERHLQSQQDFLKKIHELESMYKERQIELQERLDQANLQLSQFKIRSEEEEKLMDEAISEHIALQETLQAEKKRYKELDDQHQHSLNQLKVLEHNFAEMKVKKQHTISELMDKLQHKHSQIQKFKIQVNSLKTSIQKHEEDESTLRAEINETKKQKGKTQQQLIETLERLQVSQNKRIKAQEEIIQMIRKLQNLNLLLQHSKSDSIQRQKKCQERLQEIQNNHNKQVDSKVEELNTLIKKMKHHEQTIKSLSKELQAERQEVEQLQQSFKRKEEEYQSLLKDTEQQLNQTIQELRQLKKCQITRQSGYLLESTNRLNEQINIEEKFKANQANDALKSTRLLLDQQKTKNNELSIQNETLKEKMNNYEAYHKKITQQIEELCQYKQKWELQIDQIEKIENQLNRQKQSNIDLKTLFQNKIVQIAQLQVELEEKQSAYRKLVQKIAIQGSNKAPLNSGHYSKTAELLEKSRTEQIELRRQNQELRQQKKEIIQKKDAKIKEIQQKAAEYSFATRKTIEQLQRSLAELDRNHQKLLNERKVYEKFTQDNQNLKQQIRKLKSNASKIAQKNEQIQGKIKRANQNSIKLQREYEQIKRGDAIMPQNTDERTLYINRLKAEVATLKTEKVLLTETLSRQRDEKSRLKSTIKNTKQGDASQITLKLQIQKKTNQNKNLTELIFEIVSQLKICVNEPKAKLEMVRSLILGTIKEKYDEIKRLKEKLKTQEATEQYRPIKVDYTMNRQSLEQRHLNNSVRNTLSNKAQYASQNEKKYAYISNSEQKGRQFQRYNAKFKSNFDQSWGKNA